MDAAYNTLRHIRYKIRRILSKARNWESDWDESQYDSLYFSVQELEIEVDEMMDDMSHSYGKRRPRKLIESDIMELIKNPKKKPRKKGQSKKQKILEEMTQKKWKQYSKGSGKKNYFQIKAWVSKTAAYKKRVKKL